MSINFWILLYFQVAFNILIPENLAALFDTFLQMIFLRSVKPKCSNCCSIDLPRHCVPQIVTETIWLTKRVNSCPTKEIWVKRLNAKGQITTFWMHYFFPSFSLIGKKEIIRNGSKYGGGFESVEWFVRSLGSYKNRLFL